MKHIACIVIVVMALCCSLAVEAECWNEVPLKKAEGNLLYNAQEDIKKVKYCIEENTAIQTDIQSVRLVGDRLLVGYQIPGKNRWIFSVYTVDGVFVYGYDFHISNANYINYTLSEDDYSICFYNGRNSVIYRLPADGSLYEIFEIPMSKEESAVAQSRSDYSIVLVTKNKVVIKNEDGQEIIIIDGSDTLQQQELPIWLYCVMFVVVVLVGLKLLAIIVDSKN